MYMHDRFLRAMAILLLLALIPLTTCGKDSPTKPQAPEPTPPPPPPPAPVATRIEISPSSATLTSIGQTVQLSARVFDQNNAHMSAAVVTWTSSAVGVATVSGQGLITAVKNGTATITARSGNASASIPVTVMQSVGSIVIKPASATLMALGETVQLTATVLDQNRRPVADATVSWSSSDEAVITVSGQGLVTAVTNGTATITARAGNASASIPVTVMQSVGSIAIEPSTATLMSLGKTVQLTATVLDQNRQPVADATVSWSSSDEAVATVSGQGLVTAVKNGTATITGRSGSASATATVTVMQSVGSVAIEPTSATLMSLGETVQLTATVLDQNDQPVADAVVSWSSSDEAVATVSSQGLVTAVKNGTAAITARSGNASATATVTVMQSVGSVVVEPMAATLMSLGETVQLTATVLDLNRQPVADAAVSWSSSDEAVAMVSGQGLVTAVSNGSVTITARSGSESASIPVTVMQSAGSIAIEPSTATLMSLGETVQLTATVLDQNGQPVADAAVSWASSDTGVATVSGQGLVTAVSNGNVTITARSDDASASIPVTVMQSAGSVVIEPSSATLMALGETVQLTVTVLDQNGQPVADAAVSWSSSDETVATVSGQGLVTAVMNGTATITARSGDASASVSVTVMDDSGEREALVALYNATDGPNWTNNENWLTDVPLDTWYGVSTNNRGEVTGLSLSENRLRGEIPPKLGDLNSLFNLYLDGNQLTGAIPPELGQLTNLRLLNFANNRLTGAIPPELGQLRNLTNLNFGWNALTGSIPSELGQLSNLTNLTLRFSLLTGAIPPELGQLRNLKGLILDSNELSGSIPSELGQLTNLSTLILSNNPGLSGPLPSKMAELANLQLFHINLTQLCVPPTFAFQEWFHRIPEWRGDICPDKERDALIALYNRTNGPNWNRSENWTSFAPLNEWHGLTTDAEGKVVTLDLENNNLNGLIPGSLGDLTGLRALNLSFNRALYGPLPPSLTSLDLEKLLLAGTQLCTPQDIALQVWIAGIPRRNGANNCNETRRDFYALAGLYDSTNGPDWTNQSNWLSSAPLGSWHGVSTNTSGRVTEVILNDNNLSGSIPSVIGQLDALRFLDFYGNQLSRGIPLELGELRDLTYLDLRLNQFTGSIPPELGQLQNLTYLGLWGNKLTGSIPTDLGQLRNLTNLELGSNQLTGGIPVELAQLRNLFNLGLGSNQLTGGIPAELGQLHELRILNLAQNQLTGQIPVELGQLHSLTELSISLNSLTGNVPGALGRLNNLKFLGLTGNVDMSGILPQELISLDLDELLLGGTRLCAPPDAGYRDWLRSISHYRLGDCQVTNSGLVAYLTQTTQSLTHPVPLVAGEDALLRVFVTSEGEVDAAIPPVRATFYLDRDVVHTIDLESPGTAIPLWLDEGNLASSVNALVPGAVIAPGLEMVIEVDLDGISGPVPGIPYRLPPDGQMAIDVADVPPFDLTLVPFLWTESPDRSILTETGQLTAESDLFRATRNILPVGEFLLSVRAPVWTAVDPTFENSLYILNETDVIRTMDGASGHYMGTLRSGGGRAYQPGFVSTAGVHGGVIAHELGHNMNLGHAPCGSPTGVDLNFPYTDGTIGAWGYDLLEERLVEPSHLDLMSYCGPAWISDYNFSKAASFRLHQEQASITAAYASSMRGLLIWGGVSEEGELLLEPAFAVDAPPSPPSLDGPYRIVGEDEGGSALFSLPFGMAEIADGEGGSFAFVLPVRPDWPGRLARITLSGPEGVATLGDEDDRYTALLLDPVDGSVRGILRDWLEPDDSLQSARRILPEPGLEVVISRGLPASADWER